MRLAICLSDVNGCEYPQVLHPLRHQRLQERLRLAEEVGQE